MKLEINLYTVKTLQRHEYATLYSLYDKILGLYCRRVKRWVTGCCVCKQKKKGTCLHGYDIYLKRVRAEKSAVAALLLQTCSTPDACVFVSMASKFNRSCQPNETFWNVFGGPIIRVPYIEGYDIIVIDHCYNSTMFTHIVFRRRRCPLRVLK